MVSSISSGGCDDRRSRRHEFVPGLVTIPVRARPGQPGGYREEGHGMKALNWIEGLALMGLAVLLYYGVAVGWWLPRAIAG